MAWVVGEERRAGGGGRGKRGDLVARESFFHSLCLLFIFLLEGISLLRFMCFLSASSVVDGIARQAGERAVVEGNGVVPVAYAPSPPSLLPPRICLAPRLPCVRTDTHRLQHAAAISVYVFTQSFSTLLFQQHLCVRVRAVIVFVVFSKLG